jgi:hypothetical protein
MRGMVTLAFEIITLLTLLLPTVVAVIASRPRGRRLLRRLVRFPTFVWCEAEGAIARPGDPAAITDALAGLRAALPRPEGSLFPRVFVVRVVEPAPGEETGATVTVRAATLVQSKTAGEAACQLAAALRRVRPDSETDRPLGTRTRARTSSSPSSGRDH